jgi:ubiquinone/menaquinone biosynthesis C-methylase UbiE
MESSVAQHYRIDDLAGKIAAALRGVGKDLANLTTADLASIDEFHVRGRPATLELASRMELKPGSRVLDIGSGLGGPARTLAEVYGCHVTGIDLTPEFCEAAQDLSRWVGLSDRVTFSQGNATAIDCAPGTFDAAMTIHVAMNIAAKDHVYAEAHRALNSGRIFAVYDILQGEGGDVNYPVPWASNVAISHLATPAEMRTLLQGAGFRIEDEIDSTEQGEAWFRAAAAQMASGDKSTVSLRQFMDSDAAEMTRNQVRNLAERRIRTVTFVCRTNSTAKARHHADVRKRRFDCDCIRRV